MPTHTMVSEKHVRAWLNILKNGGHLRFFLRENFRVLSLKHDRTDLIVVDQPTATSTLEHVL